MDIHKNIKMRREQLGMTQDELAQKLNYKSRSSINKVELGLNDLPQSKIKDFAAALETTPSALMGWTDELDIFSIPNIIPLPKTKKIPLLGTIACGTPILAEENIEDYINIDINLKANFALRCKGESMINARIFDGDLVYIREQPDVENGEIAAVMIENEATLKRVLKYENKLILRSYNPLFDDIIINGEQLNDVRILGKAMWFASVVRHQKGLLP